MEDNFVRYNFFCTDCTCEKSNKDRRFTIELPKGTEEEPLFCINSKKVQILLKCIGEVTFGIFSKVSLMNKVQRQHMFKKRATEHYKKNIEENKRDIIKNSNPLKR